MQKNYENEFELYTVQNKIQTYNRKNAQFKNRTMIIKMIKCL